MHIAFKALIGVLTLGATTTGGYLAFKGTNDEEIKISKNKKSLLEVMLTVKDFVALDTNEGKNTEEWRKLVEVYLKEPDPSKPKKITLTGIVKKTDNNQAENINELKKFCKGLLASDNFQESDKEIVSDWCNKNSSLIKGVGS